MNLISPIIHYDNKPEFIAVDDWIPSQEEKIIKHTKGVIIIPVSQLFGYEPGSGLDYFTMSPKRCYNSDTNEKTMGFRDHCTNYLNYFLKFYDVEKELIMIYGNIKFLIDCVPEYNKDALLHDIRTYILTGSIYNKIKRMNEDNYNPIQKYRNNKNACLEYKDKHASVLMEISLFMNITIPLLSHFIHVKKVGDIKYFLLEAFDIIIHMYEDVDIYNKLYETAITSINTNMRNNSVIWDMQNIRGKSTTIHSLETVDNIILQIIPKYTYNKNIICFNFNSILQDIKFKITDIAYEFSFISLSSSKRDEDNNSEFDKFESHLTKQDESLFLQNKVNCQETMRSIEMMFGPFNPEEIKFYINELTADGKPIINSFQKCLIFNLFYKYFGDPNSIMAINKEDYVKLIIAAKRILEANGMIALPYIISSRVNRLVTRKNLNKRERQKLENSSYYPLVQEKYRNGKIEDIILGYIAQILSSSFQIIDFYNKDLNGKPISSIPEYVCEEILMYILLI